MHLQLQHLKTQKQLRAANKLLGLSFCSGGYFACNLEEGSLQQSWSTFVVRLRLRRVFGSRESVMSFIFTLAKIL